MEEKKLWYVEKHPNFPSYIKGYTVATDERTAALNVGWRNGLRGDALDNFVGNRKVLTPWEAKNQLPEKELDACTVEELIQSLKVLDKLGIDSPEISEILHGKLEKLLKEEFEKEKNSGQLFLDFPLKK